MNLIEYTYNLVKQIPSGYVSTYGAVARALGDIRAARAVGRMMNQNPDPDAMPCYKIVRSNGEIGGFGRGIHDKIKRLQQDNIRVKNNHIVNFEEVLFTDFDTDYPLKKLRRKQKDLRNKIHLNESFNDIETVAGVDVAYTQSEWKPACAACVVINHENKKIIERKTIFKSIRFPYIPTYLTFREFPLIQTVLQKLESKPTILMVDGNGILHPFRLGVASHVGVILDIPTIGVAKKLLCGSQKNNSIIIDGEKRGVAVHTSQQATNPVYVSPGNKISLDTATEIVKQHSHYKLPEPIRQAHKLANQTLRG